MRRRVRVARRFLHEAEKIPVCRWLAVPDSRMNFLSLWGGRAGRFAKGLIWSVEDGSGIKAAALAGRRPKRAREERTEQGGHSGQAKEAERSERAGQADGEAGRSMAKLAEEQRNS